MRSTLRNRERIMQLNDAAKAVVQRLESDNPDYQFDPAIILVIVEAIQTLLPLLIELCEVLPSEVPRAAAKIKAGETFADRVRWRVAYRRLRRELGSDFYSAGGAKLVDAMLDAAASTSGDRIDELWCSMR